MFARMLTMEWMSVINLLEAAICVTGNISAESIFFLVNFRQSPPFCAVEGLDENRPRERVHYSIVSFSALCLFLCLSGSVPYREFFSWPFQFGI